MLINKAKVFFLVLTFLLLISCSNNKVIVKDTLEEPIIHNVYNFNGKPEADVLSICNSLGDIKVTKSNTNDLKVVANLVQTKELKDIDKKLRNLLIKPKIENGIIFYEPLYAKNEQGSFWEWIYTSLNTNGISINFNIEIPSTIKELRVYNSLGNIDLENITAKIYAQTDTTDKFPEWKIRYIRQNREFWDENSDWLKGWIEYIKDWDNSHQKLEWNCRGNDDGDIKTKIIQFRASGIRVKLPTFSPALNLVGTQVPILPWIELPQECVPVYSDEELKQYGLTQQDIKYGRYLSVREAAALQGMGTLQFDGLSKTRIYEALGNAINVDIVKIIAEKLLNYE